MKLKLFKPFWSATIKHFTKKKLIGSILVISFMTSHHVWATWNNNELWQVMSNDFIMSENYSNDRVQVARNDYVSRRSDLYGLARKSSPYLYYVYNEVKKRNMPGELALIPMIESSYNPYAISSAGAAGLWQLMPGTASGLGLKQNWWYDGRRDIQASTKAALDYLSYLHDYFDGDWLLAIAAYHSGEGTVLKAREQNLRENKPTDYWSLPLPQATKQYIPRLLALADIVSHQQKYGVDLPTVINKPFFREINLSSQIELSKAAKLAHMDLDEFYLLNPGYNHWATAPDGPQHIILPIRNIRVFRTNLNKTPTSDLVSWKTHVVKTGETLGGIATQYHTKINLIEEANQSLSREKDDIKPQQVLLIPVNDDGINDNSNVGRQRQAVVKKTQAIGPEQIIHVVKPGDNLINIGKEYSTTSSAIRYWNQLETNGGLHVGQELVIWKPRSQGDFTYYTIKPGDTLTGVAKMFNTSINELKEWNASIGNDNKVFLNQRLMVYRSGGLRYYKVQKGDTLSAIAARFNIKLSDLKQWNQDLENAKYLYPEQTLVIAQNGRTLTYVIKPGDTLSGIAKQFHVSVSDLQRWNDFLHNTQYLYPDQEILIYTA